jgi:hypothetical protein
MTNPIDGNRSSSSPPSQATSADPSTVDPSSATSTAGADPQIGADAKHSNGSQSFFADTWATDASDGEDFMSQASAGAAPAGTDSAGDESVSVLELQAQSSAAASGSDSPTESPMADELTELLGDPDLDFENIKKCNRGGYNGGRIYRAMTNLSSSERESLAAIVAEPDEARAFFREALQGRDDIPDGMFTSRDENIDAAVDALIDTSRNRIVGDFNSFVAGRVKGIVSKASQPYQAINATGESRRAFLGQLAQLEGDAAKLEQRLTGFGLDEEAAGDIAQVLAKAHGDPKAIEALMSGEAGPERGGVQILEESKAYAFAEEVLAEELDDKLGILEQLATQAGNGQLDNSLLVNDNFKTLREQVMSKMQGGKGGPIEQIVADFTEEAASDKTKTDLMKVGLAIVTAAGATIATGGLGGVAAVGAAMATGGAQVAPDVLVAWEDVDLAEIAAQEELVMPDGTTVELGMTDDAAVDQARHNRNVTTACAVAGMVLGAAPAIKGAKASALYVDGAVDAGKVAVEATVAAGAAAGSGAVDMAAKK